MGAEERTHFFSVVCAALFSVVAAVAFSFGLNPGVKSAKSLCRFSNSVSISFVLRLCALSAKL